MDIIRVTRHDCDGGEQTTLKKQTVSLRGVYVWGVHSDQALWLLCFKGHVRARGSTL